MKSFFSKSVIFAVAFFVILGVGIFIFINSHKDKISEPITTTTVPVNTFGVEKVIGKSVEGREIKSYTHGTGENHIVFVGGIHGGYEWNSTLLAYDFINYLKANPTIIPKNLTVTVIPSANPDGLYKVIGKEGRFTLADIPKTSSSTSPGRFNANNVDLNRNFDCKWKPKSTWKGNIVSAGSTVFSEPETKAIRDFILKDKPASVIFWHSQSNAVYASQCEAGILPETLNIMNIYSKASGYPAIKSFDSYEVTGAVEDWLASVNIPAITVELKTHETVEWEKNLAGIKSLVDYYKNKPVNAEDI